MSYLSEKEYRASVSKENRKDSSSYQNSYEVLEDDELKL